jgi:hypothetical protein
MRIQLIAGAAAIAFVTLTATAGAQQTARRQGAPVPPTAQTQDEVTIIGCVEFEQDYRKRMAAGRGGVLGSGVGAADEFVLTNVRPPESQVGTSGRSGRGGRVAAAVMPGNSGSGGGVYALTGPQEQNLKRDVGRQIEVVGVIENAGKPSTGAELTDISDLPRITIKTWHPVGDFCPSK